MEEEIVLIEENDIEEIEIDEENYSGKPYELPIASIDTLGGIKVGENLTIDEDGTLNATGEITGEYEETDPTVPTYVKEITQEQIEQWNNGTGDIDLTDYAKKSELPTKTSQLTNDSGYINQLKTINGNSLVGTGNIVIEGGSENSNSVGTYIQIHNSETLWLEPETITKLNFDNENKNTTNGGLIFEDSGVRVGKGVSQLLIIAKWNNWQYDFSKYIYIHKNGSTYEMQSYPLNVNSANITSYMDVVEGDYIEIYGYHNDTERQNINSSPFSTDAKIIIMR